MRTSLNRLLLLAALALALFACQSRDAHSLVGEWLLDEEATLEACAAIGPEAVAGGEFLAAMRLHLVFGDDNSAVLTMSSPFDADSEPLTTDGATYEILSQEGNVYSVRVLGDDGEPQDATYTVNGDTMTMLGSESGGTVGVFFRQ